MKDIKVVVEKTAINRRKTAIYHFVVSHFQKNIFAAPQNDHLNFSFVKDVKVRNGQKTAGGWRRLPLTMILASLVLSLFGKDTLHCLKGKRP